VGGRSGGAAEGLVAVDEELYRDAIGMMRKKRRMGDVQGF
jgi:hypothetical protein